MAPPTIHPAHSKLHSIRLSLLLLTCAAAALPTAHTTLNLTPRTCTNHLINPSFETGSISPWLPIVTSAWSTRGVFANPFTHSGTHHYYAHSASTIESTLTLSQSGISAPVGSSVECYAWLASKRNEGVTSVEVFLDGVSCGTMAFDGSVRGYRRVGGSVGVIGGVAGMGSTIAIVATSESAGEEGWEVWIDDVGVSSC